MSNSALIALNRRSFLEFCTGDMDADGLALVKFAQNELQDMRYIFQSNPLISEASFYFENDGVYEIWPLIYNSKIGIEKVRYLIGSNLFIYFL